MLCQVCNDILENYDSQTQAVASYIVLSKECQVRTHSEHSTGEEPIRKTRQEIESSI
jgi:hypothetical protein